MPSKYGFGNTRKKSPYKMGKASYGMDQKNPIKKNGKALLTPKTKPVKGNSSGYINPIITKEERNLPRKYEKPIITKEDQNLPRKYKDMRPGKNDNISKKDIDKFIKGMKPKAKATFTKTKR